MSNKFLAEQVKVPDYLSTNLPYFS